LRDDRKIIAPLVDDDGLAEEIPAIGARTAVTVSCCLHAIARAP
jgi:hypothetical protein